MSDWSKWVSGAKTEYRYRNMDKKKGCKDILLQKIREKFLDDILSLLKGETHES